MLVMFGLLVVPLYRTIEWSFQEVQYGAPGVFVGLQNYTAALTDPRSGGRCSSPSSSPWSSRPS